MLHYGNPLQSIQFNCQVEQIKKNIFYHSNLFHNDFYSQLLIKINVYMLRVVFTLSLCSSDYLFFYVYAFSNICTSRWGREGLHIANGCYAIQLPYCALSLCLLHMPCFTVFVVVIFFILYVYIPQNTISLSMYVFILCGKTSIFQNTSRYFLHGFGWFRLCWVLSI